MKKIILPILIILGTAAHAQYYKQSAGVRTGHSSGFTYKYFYNNEQAIEFMVGGRNGGLQVTGMYQFNKPMNIAFTDMLYFHYGVGLHVGYEKFQAESNLGNPNDRFSDNRAFLITGIDTMVGMEYRMLSIPLTFGLDVKPYFQMVDMRYGNAHFWDVGASVKYVF